MVLFGTQTQNLWFSNNEFADVHFKIVSDDGETRISAHRLILGGASKELNAMMYGGLAEGNEIEIVDASAAAFTEFKRFIYTGELDLTAEIVADVMNLAHKYNIGRCFAYCVQFLEQHLLDEDVFTGFQLAVLYKVDHLKLTIGEKIGEQVKTVFASDEFVNCSRDVLRAILQIQYLGCHPEEVFNACIKWVKVTCQKMKLNPTVMQRRERLADCLYLIPFPRMRAGNLSLIIKEYKDLFNQEEVQEILEIMAKPMIPHFGKFNRISALPEGLDKNEVWTPIYNRVNQSQLQFLKKSEVTSYLKSKRSLLSSVRLLTIRHNQFSDVDERGVVNGKSLTAILTVVEKSMNGSQVKALLKQKITIDVYGTSSNSTKLFSLERYLLLEEGKDYEFRIDFDSSWTENTFFAVVPFPDVNEWNGLVSELIWNSVK